MLTRKEVEAIQARADAATEGPWELHEAGKPDYTICHDNGDGTCAPLFERCGWKTSTTDPRTEDRSTSDGDFIASSRTDVPALCAALAEAMEAIRACVHNPYVSLCDEDVALERLLAAYDAEDEG